jgi:dihydropteroate synthase
MITFAGLRIDSPLIMGIVNATPDSFHVRHPGATAAIAHARAQIADGADIVDIGGESTRPGSEPVSEVDELGRVVPVLQGLRGSAVPVSVDTSKPIVMRAALEAGATIVNDVAALAAPGAVEIVAASGASAVLMHLKGTPATMNVAPRYDDVVREVYEFLSERIMVCRAAGIPLERLAVDPGIGFGKTRAHNEALIARLKDFRALGCAVLLGVSGKMADDARIAAESGADILRVHDVQATRAALGRADSRNRAINR